MSSDQLIFRSLLFSFKLQESPRLEHLCVYLCAVRALPKMHEAQIALRFPSSLGSMEVGPWQAGFSRKP